MGGVVSISSGRRSKWLSSIVGPGMYVNDVSGRPIAVAGGKYAVRVQADERGCQAVTEDAVEKRILGPRQPWQNGTDDLVNRI
jgi:hypothetical protein